MDAAQKLFKNIAILTAAALLLSTVALAQTLVAPATVAISTTTLYNTASVTSSDGSPITYTIGLPVYSGGDQGTPWLYSVTAAQPTNPSTLTFTVHNVAGLSAAAHSATVTLTASSPAGLSATITVSYDTSGGGGGGGGGGSTLIPSQPSIALASAASTTTINITNSSVANTQIK